MYWYKLPKPILLLLICSASLIYLAGCKPAIKQNGSIRYFDLKKYFTDEALRLDKQHKAILKTVNYNNQPEKKTILIKNWQREFALFIESDINKPSWRDSYKGVTNADSIVYTAIDTNLRTRRISISLKANKVTEVHILNFTKNLLYQTKENLNYYPDSAYQIEKHQLVRILGANNYQIIGRFK
jgi:hypothetical protein